jgi:hypothetical protein
VIESAPSRRAVAVTTSRNTAMIESAPFRIDAPVNWSVPQEKAITSSSISSSWGSMIKIRYEPV